MTAGLKVSGLVAGYADRPVITELDLTVRPGEVVAVLGANGAGKTTTLMSIAGLVPVQAGNVSLHGVDITHLATHRRAQLGISVIPTDRGLFPQLTVGEHMRLRTRTTRAAIDDVLGEMPRLAQLWSRRAGLLSGGEQQLLALGCALATRPALLVVDELSHGLAPVVVQGLLPLIRRLADGGESAALLVEQHTANVLEMADRAYVLARGRVVSSGSAAELRDSPDLIDRAYFGAAAQGA